MYMSHIWEKSGFWHYGWNAVVQSDRKFLNQLYCISTTDLWNNLVVHVDTNWWKFKVDSKILVWN